MLSVQDERPQRLALYCRVSTEEQAERQTVDAQTDFLRRHCDLFGTTVAGVYIDDGISGTLPLGSRPDGARLLAAAQEGAFDAVLVTRVDRMSRSLAVLMDAHTQLDKVGVAIRSATEPFDSSTPIGKFMLQLLGSMAELDRSSTLERLNRGRDRVARSGKWAGGAIPFGYDLDKDRRLIPSQRVLVGLERTEAEVMAEVFTRMEAGSTLGVEVERLNAMGVSGVSRWSSGKERSVTNPWTGPRLAYALHNPTYKGAARLDSRFGTVETEVPALVSEETWANVQRRLTLNRKLSKTGTSRFYLLRGLVTCEGCRRAFVGFTARPKRGSEKGYPYYSCSGSQTPVPRASRCDSKSVPAEWIEDYVWQGCREFILNPGPVLAEAQADLKRRLVDVSADDQRRRALLRQLAAKEQEHENVMTLFRRGRATLEQTERQLDAVTAETADLRGQLDALNGHADQARGFASQITSATVMLGSLRDQLEEIDRTNDLVRKREIVELLVNGVVVRTLPRTQRVKDASVTVRYAFGEPQSRNCLQVATGSSSG